MSGGLPFVFANGFLCALTNRKMINYNLIKTYESIIQSYHRLQTSIADLIKASGAKHQEVWNKLGFKKDTFYRRLRLHDWNSKEMQIMIPFLISKVKKSDPDLYQQIINEPAVDSNGKLTTGSQ
jgi:hypothetical protein